MQKLLGGLNLCRGIISSKFAACLLRRNSSATLIYWEHIGKSLGAIEFGWAPIADFELVDRDILIDRILPFLASANSKGERVVIHFSGAIGRTGQVLAAWLVSGRGLSNKQAIAAVKKTGRNPYEAAIVACLKGRNPWLVVEELNALLDDCCLAARNDL